MSKSKNRLILEFTEFNLQRMNPDVGGLMPNVSDPQLSINAFDKHQDAIRAATSKLNTLLKSMSNSSGFSALKSKLHMEDQDILSMKIIRILKSEIRYDIYISFVIGENEYWGVVEDILSEEPRFKSEVIKDNDLVLTKEWIIKIKGIIIKIIRNWLTPKDGIYKLISDYCYAYNVKTGELERITKENEVEVIRSFDNKIVIKYNNEYYNLIGDYYVYFNYWFIPKF